jgi:hypothetical protein
MRTSTLFLAGSLIVNVALLGTLVTGLRVGDEASSREGSLSLKDPRPGFAPERIDPETWTKLRTTEFNDLCSRLRAAGFSPGIARALLVSEVRAQSASLRTAINARAAERPFWEPERYQPGDLEAWEQLEEEENRTITQSILADTTPISPAALEGLRRRYPNFSEEKLLGIHLSGKELSAYSALGIRIATKELVALLKKRDEAITRLLTPEEREQYDLWTSDRASYLREQLAAFQPSEEEFLTIYRLFRTYAETSKPTGNAINLDRPNTDAEKTFVADLKAALGESRFAEYVRSSDSNYQTTVRLVARLEMPVETANQVYLVQKETQQRLADLEADRTLTTADWTAQVTALTGEAEVRVGAILGPAGLSVYRQYGGTWMDPRLHRPPKTISQR